MESIWYYSIKDLQKEQELFTKLLIKVTNDHALSIVKPFIDSSVNAYPS